MKFETTLECLTTTTGIAARFAEKKPNLPVLGCVLITAQGDRVVLRATNLECGVELVVLAKISEEGVVAIPAAVFAGFLSNARGKQLTLSTEGEVVVVKTDRAKASIKTVPYEDFPVLPRVSAEQSFSIKAGDMVRAIRSVLHCASLSAIKPELQSVLMYAEAGKLFTVATDSFRLAEKTTLLKNGGNIPHLLIPAKNAGELMRILENEKEEIEFYYNENQLSVQTKESYYTSRLLDGAFPNYRQIMPKTFITEAVVLREDMAAALKSLSVFADKFAQILVTLDVEAKSMLLSSRNPDVGEQISTIKAVIEGETVSISFNGRYLGDSLQGISGESVRLHSNGPGKAILVKDAGDDSFQYLAMPMNR